MLPCVRNVTEVLSDRKFSLFFLLEGNKTTQLPEYVNISGLGHTHTHTHTHTASVRLLTTPLLYTIPANQLLTTPTHTSPLRSSANTSPRLYRTAQNHGYQSVAEYSSAAILSPGLCARSPENDEKRSKGSKIVGSYIPYGLFQTKGELCAKFGSDWFRHVNLYKVQTHTHTDTQTNIQLYINYEE
jgi:hypothetical protein